MRVLVEQTGRKSTHGEIVNVLKQSITGPLIFRSGALVQVAACLVFLSWSVVHAGDGGRGMAGDDIRIASLQVAESREKAGDTPVYALEDVFNLALQEHPRIRAAERRVVISRLLPARARVEMMPKLNAYGTYNHADRPILYYDREVVPEDQTMGDLELLQPLFKMTFFPRRRQAFEEIEGSRQEYFQQIQDTLYQVAQAYYQVLQARELLRNARDFVDLTAEGMRVSETMFKAGQVTEDVVVRAELNVTKARGNLLESENNLELQKNILRNQARIRARDFEVAPPPGLQPPAEDFETIFKRALASRHDYQAAKQQVKVSDLDVEIAEANFWPSLEGAVRYYVNNNPAYDQDFNYLLSSVQLSIPLYDGGTRYSQLREQRENLKIARLALRELYDTIKVNLHTSLTNIDSYRNRLENLKKQVDLAEKTYEMTNTRFSYGAATSLDRDQAVTDLNRARTELIVTSYEYQMELLNLRKVTGTFVEEKVAVAAEREKNGEER